MKNFEQILASDPAHSVWVAASAGTGKTKVLTDRVLRLMLAGVSPDKILCLTFTNAAAAEMLNRITAEAIKWQKDISSLEIMLGRAPSLQEQMNARSLFSELMLLPGQLSVHTIHSFCKKILQSFPFEAGLVPGFKVIGAVESNELIDLVIKDLGSSKEESVLFMLQNVHQNIFLELVAEILEDQIYFRDLFEKFPSARGYEEFLLSEISADSSDIEGAISVIISKLDDANIQNQDQLFAFFLTKNGDMRKKLISKKESDTNPTRANYLFEIQKSVYAINQNIRKLRMITATIHLYKVAKFAIEKYSFFKNIRAYLDYDDLIYYTKKLLTNSSMKDWVLYKLDGGIKHLLVDEAQDTSPEQWQIIEAIMREFYSGNSENQEERTIFIVGDDKQSIYSFQGADVSNFTRFNEYIKKQMLDASKSYKDVELKWSYRSSKTILKFVDHIWEKILHKKGAHLEPFRDSIGAVELWPIEKGDDGGACNQVESNDIFWPLLEDMKSVQDGSKVLAKKIATYIRDYLATKPLMHSTGLEPKPEDFMILLRRRGDFMKQVIVALKEEGVPVGGLDRMVLTEHISVQDILSLAKYALLPNDKLNFAELLKSPIIGMSEEELYDKIVHSKSFGLEILSQGTISATSSNLFNFFYHLIEIVGLRSILASAGGESTHDALDELLNLAAEFEKSYSSNLQEFIYWLERRDLEIKRETSQKGFVRVMTIHGSKGLQAPVVILADTVSLPSSSNSFLWGKGLFLWLGSSSNSNEIYDNLKEVQKTEDYKEYLRLFYVALTRAEDHMIIAGSSNASDIPEGCFYDIAAKAMYDMGCTKAEDGFLYLGERVVLQKSEGQIPSQFYSSQSHFLQPHSTLDNYAKQIFDLQMPKIESNISIKQHNVSPLESRKSLNYGELIHKILEDSINIGNFSFSPEHPALFSLQGEVRSNITEKLVKLFAMEEFRELINSAKLQTEVAIGYNDSGDIKIGRIDLLAIKKEEIFIIDYKTDKKIPESSDLIPQNYLKQLEFYKNAIHKIYPNSKITTKILWIEGPVMM